MIFTCCIPITGSAAYRNHRTRSIQALFVK